MVASIRDLLESATDKLKISDSAVLDSEVLLSFVLDNPREYLFAHLDEIVVPDKVEQFNSLVTRRSKREPIAYLTKQKEFYGRAFFVDERAHIPRPATEDLIDCVKSSLPADFNGTIADIGTGSGCIGITLALEYPLATVIATDISDDALDVARQNAELHQIKDRITFLSGDLLSPLEKLDSCLCREADGHRLPYWDDNNKVDVVVSNPPYGWHNGWTDDVEVFSQPRASYDGGKDGLDIIKRLLDELPKYLKDNGKAFFEFDPRQRKAIESILSCAELKFGASFVNWQIKKDLSGWDRVFVISNPTRVLPIPTSAGKLGTS